MNALHRRWIFVRLLLGAALEGAIRWRAIGRLYRRAEFGEPDDGAGS